MAVDLTPSFHVALYMIFLESLLFFAVIMQTKSVEPGTHSGIARYFGLLFLFQSLAALTLALSEQLYDSYISFYLSLFSTLFTILAVTLTIPAATSIAIPNPYHTALHAVVSLFALAVLLLFTFPLSSTLAASPDIPYLPLLLRRELLGAITGALVVLSIAATVRMLRQLKGRNGAFILLAGLALTAAFGLLWERLEPLCKQTKGAEWPATCPLPAAFDHNFMIAVLIIVANVLAAEGVLRLMAAGSGVEGQSSAYPTQLPMTALA